MTMTGRISTGVSLSVQTARTVFLAGVALCALMTSPLLAADIEAKSKIEAVTVYPDGAIVRREVELDLPQGSNLLIFRGLPASIDPASLRVEGQATGSLTLGAVESRMTPADTGKPGSTNEEALKSLRLDREKYGADMEAIEGRRAMIQRFSQSGPERQGDQTKGLEVEKWAAAWDAVGTALGKANDDLRRVRGLIRETDEKIRAIEMAEGARRGRPVPEREFTVALDASTAVKGRLVLSYRVSGALWRPAYDARLETGEGGKNAQMVLVRRALVSQRTGEDWGDVALTLSTTRASRGTAVPEVNPQRVAFFELPPPMPMGATLRRQSINEAAIADSAQKSAAPAAAPAPESKTRLEAISVAQAELDSSGFQASYRIAGRLTVPRDGAEKSFAIQSRTLQPEILIRAAPALDPTAFLEAAFINTDDSPLLAGEVSLMRDGSFAGRGRLGFTAAGDKVLLGFGADDRVKVTRVPVRRRETEPSLLGSTKSDTREFKIVIRNLHDFAVKASVVDQIPYSEAANITVEALANITPPTEKTVQDKRGVSAWTYDLKPGEEKEIRVGYRIRWPSDRELVFESMPLPR